MSILIINSYQFRKMREKTPGTVGSGLCPRFGRAPDTPGFHSIESRGGPDIAPAGVTSGRSTQEAAYRRKIAKFVIPLQLWQIPVYLH